MRYDLVVTDFLTRFGGDAVAAIAMALVAISVRPHANRVEGRQVLAYGRSFRIFVIICWLCWIGLFIAALLFARAEDSMVASILVWGFFLLILPLHLEIFRVRVEFDKDG